MADFELLGPLHPALKWNDSLLHLFEEAGRALHWYELLYTGGECRSWLVYMLCLLADLRPVQVAEFCQRLHVPPRIRLILQEERRTALTVKKTWIVHFIEIRRLKIVNYTDGLTLCR